MDACNLNHKRQIIKADTVARKMNVTRQTVMNWIAAGVLRATVINRQYFIEEESLTRLTQLYPDIVRQEENIRSYKIRQEQTEKKLHDSIIIMHWEMKSRRFGYERVKRFCGLYMDVLQLYGLNKDSIMGRIAADYLNGETIERIADKFSFCTETVRKILADADRLLEKSGETVNWQHRCVDAEKELALLREREKVLMNMLQQQGEEEGRRVDDEMVDKFQIKINSLPVSIRLKHVCTANDINTIGDLVRYKEKDLMQLRNFGKKCLAEVDEILNDMNLQLDMIRK